MRSRRAFSLFLCFVVLIVSAIQVRAGVVSAVVEKYKDNNPKGIHTKIQAKAHSMRLAKLNKAGAKKSAKSK